VLLMPVVGFAFAGLFLGVYSSDLTIPLGAFAADLGRPPHRSHGLWCIRLAGEPLMALPPVEATSWVAGDGRTEARHTAWAGPVRGSRLGEV
jgi:hypothetical protein